MVAEQLGKTVAPGPLYPVSTVLAAPGGFRRAASSCADDRVADRRRDRRVVGGVRAGPGLGAARAVSHRDGRPSPATASTGSKTASRPARRATCCSWWPTDAAVRQFLVPTDAPGVRIEPQQSIDMVKQYARVQFDGVEVDRGAAIDGTAELIDRQSQIAQVLQCAEVVGILQTVFDFTVAWALDRHSFGRPLASYQALKHRFADMKMWLEACRATTAAAVADIAARSADAELVGQHRQVLRRGDGHARSSRRACRCTAESASRGSTTCTCTCGGQRCTAPCSARRRSTTCGCTRCRRRVSRRRGPPDDRDVSD